MRTRRPRSSSDPVPPEREGHNAALLHESVDSLQIRSDDTVVDATLGGAGHARVISHLLGEKGTLIGFDADASAIARAESALTGARPHIVLIHANFRHMQSELAQRGVNSVDKVLFDLGWSSYQLSAGRGFSFLTNEPLLMSYASETGGLTARTIVNDWSESSLADVIFGWGEERYARRIAARIVEARERAPIETAEQLAEIVKASVPIAYQRGKLHPATKTFQALRIAVNDELGALKDGLSAGWEMLNAGGRIAVITFHSIEDRIVKRTFLAWEKEGTGIRLTKKPIVPSREERVGNPRSRSAKLRTIEKQYVYA